MDENRPSDIPEDLEQSENSEGNTQSFEDSAEYNGSLLSRLLNMDRKIIVGLAVSFLIVLISILLTPSISTSNFKPMNRKQRQLLQSYLFVKGDFSSVEELLQDFARSQGLELYYAQDGLIGEKTESKSKAEIILIGLNKPNRYAILVDKDRDEVIDIRDEWQYKIIGSEHSLFWGYRRILLRPRGNL
jgi:hypothetical protein